MRYCPLCLAKYPEDEATCAKDRAPTVGSLELAQARTLLGKPIGGYLVHRVIARGGMGEVYEARHPALGRRVAVKVMAAEYAQNASHIERFMAEARAVNLIRHEHIIEVIDLASLPDGRPYLVMQYLEGESLARWIKREGPARLSDIGAIMLPVLDALHAVHGVGIVHRDLKPDNIYLSRERGRLSPKVLDFGIAKLLDRAVDSEGGSQPTTTGQVLGTPSYMSPEQAAGLPKKIDARSDVYAAGVILYKMCCGRPPFVAEGHGQLLMKIMTEPPPPVRSFRPDLPQDVEVVIQHALAKEREERWQSTRAMAEALRQALIGAGVPAATLPEPSKEGPAVREPIFGTLLPGLSSGDAQQTVTGATTPNSGTEQPTPSYPLATERGAAAEIVSAGGTFAGAPWTRHLKSVGAVMVALLLATGAGAFYLGSGGGADDERLDTRPAAETERAPGQDVGEGLEATAAPASSEPATVAPDADRDAKDPRVPTGEPAVSTAAGKSPSPEKGADRKAPAKRVKPERGTKPASAAGPGPEPAKKAARTTPATTLGAGDRPLSAEEMDALVGTKKAKKATDGKRKTKKGDGASSLDLPRGPSE